MVRSDTLLGQLASAARPRETWFRVTASPWWTKVLVAAGARRAPARLPNNMLHLLDMFGRFEFDQRGSGIDVSEISALIGRCFKAATADRDGFLAELQGIVGNAQSDFVVFGAACLVSELFGNDALNIAAALPFIDAGVAFKTSRSLPETSLTTMNESDSPHRQ